MTGSISRVYTLGSGRQVILLADQTTLELDESDVEILKAGFRSECEACGYDPDEDEYVIGDDEEDEDDGELPEVR